MKPAVVLTTAPDLKTARTLARLLVSQKLAPCVSISSPAESVYRWKGRIEINSERLLLIKTAVRTFPKLESFMTRRHPYQVPELLSLTVNRGSQKYLAWLDASLK